MTKRDRVPNRDRIGSFGQAFGGGFIDVPFIEPGRLPYTLDDLQRVVGINPRSAVGQRGALRLPNGKYVFPDSEHAYEAATEYALDRGTDIEFAYHMKVRRARGNSDLGTYRSKRVAADKQREAERMVLCDFCGGPMPEGRYSNALTCSPKCAKARQRREASSRALNVPPLQSV